MGNKKGYAGIYPTNAENRQRVSGKSPLTSREYHLPTKNLFFGFDKI